MKIDLVKLVEEVYKLEGEPKNVNKVFALICLQAFKEQLTLTDVSTRELPPWVRPLITILTMSLTTLYIIYKVFYVC